ncbi:methylated-DNA--[protein]-cysteine S-methyltransferase [Taibaiella sp. KBW10]|uniref:methylated-DNA--[protein]-cysteine S-methyltransferase n=1 Tax=Taibaiella sp. KBW10 TaxID=2153357 RepID=UPI0018F3928C|nr:methylated-DNA--[protein]-cysteine S-methyltransferase [Taibaiella sp. KBW10]
MNTQEQQDYQRIAEAIDFIKTHFRKQPGLEEIAAQVHMSPFHFQRLFTEWAGTSPKKFLQYISLEHAKGLLKAEQQASLFDAAYETGLSSTSRLHELFIKIEGMSPASYKNGAAQLTIHYDFFPSPFGKVIIAATDIGICYMAFEEEESFAVEKLQTYFPHASFTKETNLLQQQALSIFDHKEAPLPEIKLHLKGTPFQLKVWEALLKIPMGQLTTYGTLAKQIEQPNASRAVGTAIGSNPIAFLIPCHRVIQATGNFGGYMWGPTRKTAIIGWEQAQIETTS